MIKEYWKYFGYSLPISLIVFLLILYPLVSLKKTIELSNTINSVDENLTIPSDEELYDNVYALFKEECGKGTIYCAEEIPKEIKIIKEEYNQKLDELEKKRKAENRGFITYLLDTNYLILFIYTLLILALNLQIATLLYLKRKKIKVLDKQFEDILDWSINTPPILGVLGTIVSFSVLVAQSGDIQESFSKSFFDAALTTIAGGFIYTLNMFLKIFISKYISSR